MISHSLFYFYQSFLPELIGRIWNGLGCEWADDLGLACGAGAGAVRAGWAGGACGISVCGAAACSATSLSAGKMWLAEKLMPHASGAAVFFSGARLACSSSKRATLKDVPRPIRSPPLSFGLGAGERGGRCSAYAGLSSALSVVLSVIFAPPSANVGPFII